MKMFFQTIALISVREGVVQLGAVHKVSPLSLSFSIRYIFCINIYVLNFCID